MFYRTQRVILEISGAHMDTLPIVRCRVEEKLNRDYRSAAAAPYV